MKNRIRRVATSLALCLVGGISSVSAEQLISIGGSGNETVVREDAFTVGAGSKFKDYFAKFEDYPLVLWDLALKTNVTGTMLCCQAAGKVMLRQKSGVILNRASVAASSAPSTAER